MLGNSAPKSLGCYARRVDTRASLRRQLEELLDESFEDLELSRGEKRALGQKLASAAASDDDRAYLRHAAFALAQSRIEGGADSLAVLRWLERAIKVFIPQPTASPPLAEVYFSPGVTCRERIRRAFRDARQSVDVCVFTITDNEVADTILAAHGRGVRLRLISDNDKSEDRGSDIDRLRNAGVPVRLDHTEHHMHHKFAVFDGELLLSGSYNWTRSAAQDNEENVVATTERRIVGPFVEEFERLWRRFG